MAKYYRTNQNIANRPLLVIDNAGGKLGVIERDEAIRIAKEKEMDLVEIAGNANPPVAKIVNFQKFKYEESKKEQAARKNAKDVELKEIWLTPRIAEHDLQTRLRRVDEFIKDGNKVMFRVKFKGREMAHLELGFNILNKIFAQFGEKIIIERAPKVEGRSITAIIGRGKGGANRVENQESRVKEEAVNNTLDQGSSVTDHDA